MLYFMDRDDICTPWKLYKDKYGDVRPEEVYERVIYYSLKIMFEPNDGDLEWKTLKAGKVQQWFLYQSFGVHALTVGGSTIYMLVEKDYPVLNFHTEILTQMVQPSILQLQRHFLSDHQAYKLLQKYEKILDPSLRKKK